MMIEALKSPVIQVESLKTKFDTTVVSNSLIALLDYSYEEARFLQQLHYWSYSQYGVVIDGIRWIYKSVREWLSEVLAGMSEWKLRKAIASLLSKRLIRREKLYVKHHQQEYQSPWWNPKNQTYYYSIDYEELQKLIEEEEKVEVAESTETICFEDSTELSLEEIKETKYCGLSQDKSKNTNYRKKTTKQRNPVSVEIQDSVAAALPEINLEEENQSKEKTFPSQSSALPERKDENLSSSLLRDREEKKSAQVDEKVNLKWKSQLKDLDNVGIRVNQTLISLIKSYPPKEVENAIALIKKRKRSQHVPNPAGYFTRALEENWSSQNVNSERIDTASVFGHWYDLARELGYCAGQEVREGEQWVCLSGSWEKWTTAVERGYSLDYLKKILKRNKG